MIPDAPPELAPGFFAVPAGHLAAVVTALDTRTPPVTPVPPAPAGYDLRRVAKPDPAWYRAVFRRVGEHWLWVSRLVMPKAELEAALTASTTEVFVVVPAGRPIADAVGLAELSFARPGQCEVVYFGLERAHTGKGLGRWLMASMLARAWAEPGVERVWLHTCTLDDPNALAFYRRQGFVPYARQVEILRDPRVAGLFAPDVADHAPVIP
jgi:GNAT superfamily N-acetyltransferase